MLTPFMPLLAVSTLVQAAPPPAPARAIAAGTELTLPPESASIVAILEGRGVQIYACSITPQGYRWQFRAPEAQLFNLATGKPTGHHGAGPSWTMDDGSALKGLPVRTTPGMTAGDVPWLLLQATPAPGATPGVLDTVSYVRRYNTHGGVAPLTGCDTAHDGQELRVPYSATYAFYAVPGAPSNLQTTPPPPPPAP